MEEFTTPPIRPDNPEPPEPAPFMVDLTKEEYVEFQMLYVKKRGALRFHTAWVAITLVLTAMIAMSLLMMYQEEGRLDPVSLIMLGSLLLLSLILWIFVPMSIKKRAQKTYDQARTCGNNFYGRLEIYPDRIEKVGEKSSARIPLNGQSFFIETDTLMVFTTFNSMSLVLPARCMTPEMAAAVRQAADRLPMRNRQFIKRFQPQGRPVEPPEETAQPEILWEQAFTYTPEEYTGMVKEALVQRYWHLAPFMALMSAAATLPFTMDGIRPVSMVLSFAFLFLLVTALSYWLPLSRLKRQAAAADQRERSYTVRIDKVAFRVEGYTKQEMAVTWKEISHVYNRDAFVELTFQKAGVFRIPKRCIEDFAAFEAVIDSCHHKKK